MNLCWWCCHSIHENSLQVPTAYNHKTKQYTGIGQFCSIPCLKAFSVSSPLIDKHRVNNLITMMIQDSQPNATLHVQSAPHWQCLQAFGGTMSIDDFRKVNRPIHFTFKPIERVTYDVEKKNCTETLIVKDSVDVSCDRVFSNPVQVINNPLKIKSTQAVSNQTTESILCLLNRTP